MVSKSNQSQVGSKVQQNDDRAKHRMKEHADTRSRAKQSNIKVGDTVLIRQRKENKWSTKFDPSPFRVVRRKGTMVTALRNGKYVSRNTSLFKKITSMSVKCQMMRMKISLLKVIILEHHQQVQLLPITQPIEGIRHVTGDPPGVLDRMYMNSEPRCCVRPSLLQLKLINYFIN